MLSPSLQTRTLITHFFRRFFDNDTVHVQAETLTTVIRSLAAVAAPGLMAAFFLINQYPGRSLWGSIVDQYLFVVLSFVALGAVAVVELELLFPDRQDFLILTPLSLQPRQLLTSKLAALAAFLGLFLLAANLIPAILLPAVTKQHFLRQLYAQTVATSLAATFAALAVLALAGLLLCVLDPRRFRLASPALQLLTIAALILLLIHYGRYGNDLPTLLADPLARARYVPTFWFLAIYESLLHGPAAPPFARHLAPYGYTATALAATLAAITYPLAWARMQRMSIEGVTRANRKPPSWPTRLIRTAIRRPGERAIFHFIGHTIARNPRYQVYLALYGGTGLALALACALTIVPSAGQLHLAFQTEGLHALLPLLLFWLVAGLRTAFTSPLNLTAGWIFRITAVPVQHCAAAARHWTLAGCLALTALILAITATAGCTLTQLLVQAIVGLSLSLLLTDAFFTSEPYVPFNRPRMPGRTNFPLLLTLYIAILPLFVLGAVHLEATLETHPARLLWLAAGSILIHLGLGRLRDQPTILEEELEGYDEDFQLLGLS